MPIAVTCPDCGTKSSAPDQAAGKEAKCPKCRGRIAIPIPLDDPPTRSTGLAPPASDATPTGPDLIPCSRCGRRIAPDATSCPGCGARNTWLHPEIRRFIASADSFKDTPPFNYTYGTCQLHGTAQVATRSGRLLDFGIKAMAGGLLCGMVGGLLNPLLPFIGGAALFVGIACTLVSVFGNARPAETLNFSIDFRESPPHWASNDDGFWKEVKAFFFGPRGS